MSAALISDSEDAAPNFREEEATLEYRTILVAIRLWSPFMMLEVLRLFRVDWHNLKPIKVTFLFYS